MGLFDKFRKKVRKAASKLTRIHFLQKKEATKPKPFHIKNNYPKRPNEESRNACLAYRPNLILEKNDDWEDFDEEEELQLPSTKDDEWDDWDDEEEYTLPTKLTRKEKKLLAKEAKKEASRKKAKEKEMKKRR